MRGNGIRRVVGLGLLLCGVGLVSAAGPRSSAVPAAPQANDVSVGADNIGGTVTSSKGPEAGVWVIA